MSNKCLKSIAIIWSLAAIAAITFLPGRPSPGLNPVAELTHRAGAGEAVPEQGPSSPPMSGRWVDVTMNVSAYCSCAKCCGTCSPGITASGATVDAVSHLVAAPPEYPFGTVMIVPGYGSGPVCVLDRGGAIKGNKLDVYFPTHQAALNWGRRELTVKIWEQTDGR